MGEGRAKSPKKLKAIQKKEKEQKNFTIEENKFIIANAPNMTVAELAEKLDCTEFEIERQIKQYNSASNDLVRGSYAIPAREGKAHLKGVVVGTAASSQLGDKNSRPATLMPKVNQEGIFHQPK